MERSCRLPRIARRLEVAERIARTGVVGTLRGAEAGNRAVALRADMDALVMSGATGLDWVSEAPGRMHACRHNGHTAVLLGAAAWLAARGWAGLLAVVGRNTLAIYLLHTLALRLLVEVDRPDAVPHLAWIALLVVATVAATVAAGRVLARVPGLLSLPGRLRRALLPAASSPALGARA